MVVPPHRGYVWGRIWSIVIFIIGALNIVFGVVYLVRGVNINPFTVTGSIFLLLAGILLIVDAVGMWSKRGWALVITNALLGLSFFSNFVIVLYFLNFMPYTSEFNGYLILSIIRVIIDILWLSYFYKRRKEYT